jgi:branched-chain amino acid transport system substrate-binding protein
MPPLHCRLRFEAEDAMSLVKFTVGALKRASIHGAAFAGALAIQAAAHASGNEIVAGQLFDQSQAWIEAGRDYAAGAKTYFDLINSEGGVNGKRIVYVTRNSTGSTADISRAAMELINEAKADVLFGPIGDAAMRTLTATPLPEMQGVAIFGPLTGLAASHAGVQTLRANYQEEAVELVRHFHGLGLTSFCLVFSHNVDQQAAITAVRQAVAATGKPLTCEAQIETGDRDTRRAAQLARDKKPQAVIVLGDTSVLGNFAREFPFKQLGILIGGLSLVNHTALTEIAGPHAVKGIVLTQVVPSPQREGVPIVREHIKAMKKYRDEPPSHLTLEGFIAAKALVESLRAGLNGKPVRREDVAAALLRNQPRLNASLAGSDMGMVNTKGGKAVDVTMVRGDGTLIR